MRSFIGGRWVFILLLCQISGCSSLWKEVGYIPIESEGWFVEAGPEIKSGNTYPKGSVSAKYHCGDIEILMHNFGVVARAFWGPPVLPFIPSLEKQKALLSLNIEGPYKEPLCPRIKVEGSSVEGKRREGKLPWQQSTMICDYEFPPPGSISLRISSENFACPIAPLKIQQTNDWRYRPFVVPRT